MDAPTQQGLIDEGMTVASTVAHRLRASVREELPADVERLVKRFVLDTIGCIFGGLGSGAAEAALNAIGTRLGAPGDCMVVGQPNRTSALNAALANGAMLRFLDFNDVQDSVVSSGPRHGHNSEIIPSLLALGEEVNCTGSRFVRLVSAGYDLATRFTDAVVGASLEQRGWNMDLRGAFVIPALAGELLGLSDDQVESAIGISLSRGLVLNVLDSSVEQNSMAKNLRFPLTAHLGIMSAYLAESGMSGPARALEGDSGFVAIALKGGFDTQRLLSDEPRYRIRDAALKAYAACYSTHGQITAIIDLSRDHRLVASDVESIHIRTTTRGAQHTGDPIRRHPRNKETADHSAYYLAAVALAERAVSPAQYSEGRYDSREIHDLAEKVEIEGDSSCDPVYPSAKVTIRTNDGRVLRRDIEYPRGHPKNPTSDVEIEEKFRSLAQPHVSASAINKIIHGVKSLENVEDLREFTQLLSFPVKTERNL